MSRRFALACLLAMFLSGGMAPDGLAQRVPSTDSTALGVVWAPPDAPGPALQTLDRLHTLGATAVRLTTLPSSDTLFARADTLGLTLFVDLPVSYVAAGALRDSLADASPILDRVQRLARRHRSVQYVGLARYADTTVPTACSALAAWTSRLHGGTPPLRTYYVTPFTATADRCRQSVDLPLLTVHPPNTPATAWAAWSADTTAVGLGALGTWTRPDAASGLRVPHSPERQARTLERSLSHLLDSLQTPPPALFVYRWQDHTASPLPDRRYGLHDRSGARRPAADVVEGFYTGRQRVFAFPAGTAPSSAPHGLLLLGWGLIALLAGAYAQSPFVHQTAARYFAAHGFYRDAVRKGRDVNLPMNSVFLLLAATAVGLIATVLAHLAAAQPITEHVVAALPSIVGTTLAVGIMQPALTGVVAGAFAFLLLSGWTIPLVLAARSHTSFSLSQGLMLVVWPCWPVLPGMIVALLAVTQPPTSPLVLGLLLLGGSLVMMVLVTIRVLRDYGAVSTVPPSLLVPLGLTSPPSLLTLGFFLFTVQYDIPFSLIWHLLTRT